MTGYRDLEITVVYSDDGAGAPTLPRRASVRAVEGRRLLGGLTLLVAAGWLYATWFPMSHFLRTNILKATVYMGGLVDLSQVFGFKPPPPELANPVRPGGNAGDESLFDLEEAPPASAFRSDRAETEAAPPVASPERRAEAQAALQRLTVAQYAWVGIMTVVACWLALTGAAGLSGWLVSAGQVRAARLLAGMMFVAVGLITWRYWPPPGENANLPEWLQYAYVAAFALLGGAIGASSLRPASGRVLAVGLIVLGAYAGLLWRSYPWGWGLPVFAWQTLAFGVMVVAALFGVVLSAHGRGLTSAAIALIFLSCVGTVVGLWYGQRNGAFVTFTPTAGTYLKAVVIQSAFAWVLLGARRVMPQRTRMVARGASMRSVSRSQ
jgi:hypothetical protein